MTEQTDAVLDEVLVERHNQDERWGEQNHPDGTGSPADKWAAEAAKGMYDLAVSTRALAWRHILLEEFMEAMAESDPARLRAELVQVAAVAVAWIEAIDRRGCDETR